MVGEGVENAAGIGGTSRAGAAEGRAHERTPLRQAGLTIRISHEDGSTTTLLSHPRDVSAGGISFLSGTSLRSGTRCDVQFATPGGRRIVVSGEVRWGTPVAGHIHRVGVEFDRPLNERELKAVRG